MSLPGGAGLGDPIFVMLTSAMPPATGAWTRAPASAVLPIQCGDATDKSAITGKKILICFCI